MLGKVLVSQLCPALCDPEDGSLPDSSVHGFLSQGYWSGLPFPPLEELPDQEINQTQISCIGRHILLPLSHRGNGKLNLIWVN